MIQFAIFIDFSFLRPESIFGRQILERTPAGLSITYIVLLGIIIGLLAITFFGNFKRTQFIHEKNLPYEIRKRLTKTITNRSIRAWQIVFFSLSLLMVAFQAYWIYFASESNEQFKALAYKDLRTRRLSSATLRGWILDRSGALSNALAYYKLDADGSLARTYPLDIEMAHLLGTERGTPGLERTLFRSAQKGLPESFEILTTIRSSEPENKDVRLTIDRNLQKFIADQLSGKRGAIVVLDPQNGDILAMYSNPSFKLSEAQDLSGYLALEGNQKDKPLLNRALREFYVPGSTFKTFTMISAFRAGRQDAVFPSFPQGFKPTPNSRPIVDATQKLLPDGTVTGECDGGCGEKNIQFAYQVSSN
ncbi:MAG TPA: penicillin-binding transpeptidase domain-containing protein, partial [Pyrinomonadaceae bacterium]|nr:penicillin-binding transpeptidase domain-containing protein [Pyrinomonadaceae bacterium]